MENSDYSIFPSEVYLKGFLKNYSKYLGISSEQALALFRRENVSKVSKTKPNLFDKLKVSSRKIVITPNKIIIVAVLLLLAAIVIYLSSYIGKVLKKPTVTLTSPMSITTEGEYTFNTDKDSFDLTGEIDAGTKVTINGQDIGPATLTSFSKTFTLTSPSSNFVIKAVSPFGREAQVTLIVVKNNFINPDITTIPIVTTMDANVEVLIDNTNLTVSIDGASPISKSYRKGTKLNYTAKDKISITTSKASAISLTINGAPEEATGKSIIYELIDGNILKK
jgi:cytoskeletal protein RodZ